MAGDTCLPWNSQSDEQPSQKLRPDRQAQSDDKLSLTTGSVLRQAQTDKEAQADDEVKGDKGVKGDNGARADKEAQSYDKLRLTAWFDFNQDTVTLSSYPLSVKQRLSQF